MNALKQIITWTSAGFLLAMMAGTPAIADDTELLLVPPPASDQTKPRILFIIDTSTSMNSLEDTPVPYDDSDTYDGECNSDAIYWMLISGVEPDCAGTNEGFIDKDNWNCQASELAMQGLGSFNGVLAQYRDGGKDGDGSGPSRWQTLVAGYSDAYVECQADSGVHGDGRPTFLWAANGTNLTDVFTDNASSELSWGSSPRNIGYTIYTGNYLNWKADPTIVNLSRSAIMKR